MGHGSKGEKVPKARCKKEWKPRINGKKKD